MTTNDTIFDDFLQDAIERDRSGMGAARHSFEGTLHTIQARHAQSAQRHKMVMRVAATMILALIVTNIVLLASGSSDSLSDDGFISESTSYFTETLQ